MRSVILSGPRLTVTSWEEGDLADFQALHRDPMTMRFFLSGPYDEAQAARRLADFRQEQTDRGWTKWRVQDRDGRTVGRGGFGLTDDGTHRELGYLLARDLWGQGWRRSWPAPSSSGTLPIPIPASAETCWPSRMSKTGPAAAYWRR